MSDEEWAFCAPYLTLVKEDAPQREHSLRALYNGLRWFIRAGCPWRMMPNDPPPWQAVQQQTQRWLRAGCFETMTADLRTLLRWSALRHGEPTAVILDSRTLQSRPESGGRGGYDGAKKRKGSKVHAAVGTLGHLLALKARRPTSRTARKWRNWHKRSSQPPGETWNWRMWINAIPESNRRRTLPRTA